MVTENNCDKLGIQGRVLQDLTLEMATGTIPQWPTPIGSAGRPAVRERHRGVARGALPQEHWLGNRPGNWRIRRGARN